MTILLSIAAFLFTLLGGLFALKFKDRLHLILGFSAGAIIGVAFFDIIPEAIELSESLLDTHGLLTVVAAGFVVYMILDRLFVLHSHTEDDHHHHRGNLGAGSISLHSFLDGTAIGIAFQVSTEVGIVVAISVLVHKFSDGINIVNMIIRNEGNTPRALRWVLIASLAPIAGALSTLFFTLPESVLGIVLATFAGFFLYIGASDLLPESHHNHPTVWTTLATVLGIIIMYVVIYIAHV